MLLLSYGLTRASLSDKLQSPSLLLFLSVWGLTGTINIYMRNIIFTTLLSLSLFGITSVSFIGCSSKGGSENTSNVNYKGNEHYNSGYRFGSISKMMGDRKMNSEELINRLNEDVGRTIIKYTPAFGAGYNDAFDGKPSKY